MRLHENPYLPNVIIVALLFLVFFVFNLEQPTGYVTGEPAALAVAPTPLPGGCGTLEQVSGKIGIKTKKNMNAGILSGTGCAALADSQYKCPVQDYYGKKLCCISEDCDMNEICESSGIYSGFCKPVCGTVSGITCKSPATSSITAEFPGISKAAKYKMEWCVLGYAWGTAGKCGFAVDSTNRITVSGIDSNTAYALRARADEPVPDAAGGMSCSAPGKWSSPVKCSTIPLTPLPTATPAATPVTIVLANPGFETNPDGTDWTAPDGDNRIWDNFVRPEGGSHSYKIKSPTGSKCYAPGFGEYKISAFAYSEDTKQAVYYAAYTDDACGGTTRGALQVAESNAVGSWKGLSGTFSLGHGSVKIILYSREAGKYAWFDDISLVKIR